MRTYALGSFLLAVGLLTPANVWAQAPCIAANPNINNDDVDTYKVVSANNAVEAAMDKWNACNGVSANHQPGFATSGLTQINLRHPRTLGR